LLSEGNEQETFSFRICNCCQPFLEAQDIEWENYRIEVLGARQWFMKLRVTRR
jgi:hypothetical protein